jgi:hypothetical protein
MALLRRWFASTSDLLIEQLEKWALDERFAMRAVEWLPEASLGYRLLAKSYIKNDKPALAIDLLVRAPRRVRCARSIVAVLDKALRDEGDHVRAHSVLMSARAAHPSDPEVLVRLSSLYEDDAQLGRARDFLLAAEALGHNETARRLKVETVAGNFAAGRETLKGLMRSRGASLVWAAPVVNRFAPCYPELAAEVIRFQSIVRDVVRSDANALSPSRRLELALSCRMMDEARQIFDDAVKGRQALRSRAVRDYRIIKGQAERIDSLARLAWENEGADGRCFAALVDGRRTIIDVDACDPARIAEVFIPTVFYSNTEPEKQRTYPLIRQVFAVLLDRISQRRDVILVPRHQFNWRVCRPLLPGKVLSYHTRGAAHSRYLRLKEGALSGYVTLDHAGYAGFASAATDFDQVRAAVANVSRSALYENRSGLHAELVQKGESKYLQPATAAQIAGRYVFVALQVVTDEVAELAWMSSIELMNQVARLYSGTNISVVVKRHPLCKSFSLQAAMLELERQGMIIVSKASIHSLIAGAELVFTVNSGVGLEALIHGRPVVVSGLCDYAYAAACARNVEELEAAIANAEPNGIRGLEFLYYYTRVHAFKPSETRRLEERVDAWLDQPIERPSATPAHEQYIMAE